MLERTYLWSDRNNTRKIHIENKFGHSFCRVEKSGIVLGESAKRMPPGRSLCGICRAMAKKGKHRRIGPTETANETKSESSEVSECFYRSWEWKELRYKVLKHYGRKCMCCGETKRVVVDHIKPRRRYPELALKFDNLQVLCNDCNMGKGAWDETDWRRMDELPEGAATHIAEIVRH